MSEETVSRRRFIGYLAVAAAAPLALRVGNVAAQAKPAALPKLPLTNPQAKALAYTENAAAVKHAAFKPGSHCANCALYKGATGKGAFGPCTLFPQNTVAANGWCSAWAKKA